MLLLGALLFFDLENTFVVFLFSRTRTQSEYHLLTKTEVLRLHHRHHYEIRCLWFTSGTWSREC